MVDVRRGGQKPGHKYIKRTGTPGNYQYWYEWPDGSVRPGDPDKQASGKKEHAHRLLASRSAKHHEMTNEQIAKETGADISHIKNLETNMREHSKRGRPGHDFDEGQMKESFGETLNSRHEKLMDEIKRRESQKVDIDEKVKKLEDSVKNIQEREKKSLQERLAEARSDKSKKMRAERLGRVKTLPEYLEKKVKRLGKGEGRKVELDASELELLLESGIFALVSAGKSPADKKDISDKEIKERYKSLEGDLKEGGYAYSPVEGHYGGKEDSFLVMVHDAEKEHMKELGEKYNQESILYVNQGKAEGHYTTGENKGKLVYGKGHEIIPNATDYFTIMKHPDGRATKFSMNVWKDAENSKIVEDQSEGRAKGDYSKSGEPKPTNRLGPPPPENAAFIKPGKDVSWEDVERFSEYFETDFQEINESLERGIKDAGATHYSSRMKDVSSLLSKMVDRPKFHGRSLNSITDVIGTRALTDSIPAQRKMLDYMKKNYEMVEIEDSSDNARPESGYRAIHALFRTPSGRIVELQLKTHRQQMFSGFTHDNIYKTDDQEVIESAKPGGEAHKFSMELSDYLYSLDKGAKDIPENRPKEPKILADKGIKFDWSQVDSVADITKSFEPYRFIPGSMEIVMKASKPFKYYVALRNKKKQTMHVEEFDDFNSAKEWGKKMREMGHRGEVPIGTARSKKEFLETFSEYRIHPDYKEDDKSGNKKTGPGSRGGRIVGFTKSGKPIYASQKFKKSLVIKKSEPACNFYYEEPESLIKSFNPQGINERIALIKGILHGRKKMSRLQK